MEEATFSAHNKQIKVKNFQSSRSCIQNQNLESLLLKKQQSSSAHPVSLWPRSKSNWSLKRLDNSSSKTEQIWTNVFLCSPIPTTFSSEGPDETPADSVILMKTVSTHYSEHKCTVWDSVYHSEVWGLVWKRSKCNEAACLLIKVHLKPYTLKQGV